MTPTPSVAFTSISSGTTPTGVPLPDLTVHPLTHIIHRSLLTLPVNPFGKNHGAPTDTDRHVGDLGNFQTDGQGNAVGSITDPLVKLIGQESVLGV